MWFLIASVVDDRSSESNDVNAMPCKRRHDSSTCAILPRPQSLSTMRKDMDTMTRGIFLLIEIRRLCHSASVEVVCQPDDLPLPTRQSSRSVRETHGACLT